MQIVAHLSDIAENSALLMKCNRITTNNERATALRSVSTLRVKLSAANGGAVYFARVYVARSPTINNYCDSCRKTTPNA